MNGKKINREKHWQSIGEEKGGKRKQGKKAKKGEKHERWTSS